MLPEAFQGIGDNYSLLVVGAGPAGLGVSSSITPSLAQRTLLIDRGNPFSSRNRYDARDNVCGVGGAGLFSDGKFSLFPAAEKLWELPDKKLLGLAYAWILQELGVQDIETLVAALQEGRSLESLIGSWTQKKYPSIILTLEQRTELIKRLWESSQCTKALQTELSSYSFDPDTCGWDCVLTHLPTGSEKRIHVDRLIFCAGRFFPLDLRVRHPDMCRTFRRLEVGFRIQQRAEDSFFAQYIDSKKKICDPKFKFRDPSGLVEWRTFCACSDGEVVLTCAGSHWSVSGRQDCAPTSLNNIGFNTRLIRAEEAHEAIEKIAMHEWKEEDYFQFDLPAFLSSDSEQNGNCESINHMTRLFTPSLVRHMQSGLRLLLEQFPLQGPAKIIGPTIEGVGYYPNLTCDLQCAGLPAWVCGDACGLFRGIVASMVSGYYVGAFVSKLENLVETL